MADVKRDVEIILREGQFVARETYEIPLGPQDALIEEVYGKRQKPFLICPAVLRSIHPISKRFWIGNFEGSASYVSFHELVGFPLPGVTLGKADEPVTLKDPENSSLNQYKIVECSPVVTETVWEEHFRPSGSEMTYREWKADVSDSGYMIFTKEHLHPYEELPDLIWKHPELRFFLMVVQGQIQQFPGSRDGNGRHNDHCYLFVLDKDKTPRIPALPNIFTADGKVCMGGAPWRRAVGQESVDWQNMQAALSVFATSHPNNDLTDKSLQRRTVVFDKEKRPLTPAILPSGFLNTASDARIVAFAKHMMGGAK